MAEVRALLTEKHSRTTKANRTRQKLKNGQTASGSLAAGDAVAGDDSFYDLFRFIGRAGQRVEVVMLPIADGLTVARRR